MSGSLVAVAVQPQRSRRVEVQAVRRLQAEFDVAGARRRNAERATKRPREHLRRGPALVGGHGGYRFAAVQTPSRALQHDASTKRCRGLAGQPAHFPGEVEFRRVAAARHVADFGVVGVDDRVEQFAQSVTACWIAHVHRVSSVARRMDMTIPAAMSDH
jgi:hypothetical protein